MMRRGGLVVVLLWAVVAHGQFEQQEQGLVRGNWTLSPSVFGLGTYDSRALRAEDGTGISDVYGEVGASAGLSNLGGQYDFLIKALYAYRFYSTYNDLNDDRYNLGIIVRHQEDPWSWFVDANVRKSLDYDTTVDLENGTLPGEVLTDETRQTMSLKAGTAFAGYISERSSLTPGYRYGLYYEYADVIGETFWQNHTFDLQYGYAHTDKTKATLTGSYTYNLGKKENGHIARVMVGVASRATDWTRWTAEIGVAAASYETSGTDASPIFNLRGIWQATDKVSAYVFGGNDFQSGYGGGSARLTTRLGYGADWNMRERWTSDIQVLHSSDVSIGAGEDYSSVVKTFVTGRLSHLFSETVSGDFTLRFTQDEFPEDQLVASVQISKVY